MINGVASGTFIIMADRTEKPVEKIKVGDEVLTLEGSKKVTEVYDPIVTNCVKLNLKNLSGDLIGIQLNAVDLEVLTKEYDWRSCTSLGTKKAIEVFLISKDNITEYGKNYINPRTNQNKNITLKTEYAKIQFENLGNYLVYDFKIDQVNHYITEFGVINASR